MLRKFTHCTRQIVNKEFSNLAYYFFGLLLVILSILIIYKRFIFDNNYFGFIDIGSDTILNNAAYYKYIAHRFYTGDFSMYSFESGIGTNLFAISCLIFDIFNLPFYFLGPDSVYPGLMLITGLKLVLIYSASFLLFKKYKLDYKIVILASYLITFNGYTMGWGQHYFFLTGFVYTVFLLYSFERFFDTGRWLLFVLITAIFAAFSYYLLLTSGLFLIVYFLIKLYLNSNFSTYFTSKRSLFLNFVFFGLLGLALSSVVLLPSLYHVASSSRLNTGYFPFPPSLTLAESLTYFYRFFSNDSLGIGSSFFGIPNYYEAPNVYTSGIFLILVPLLLFNYAREHFLKCGAILFAIFVLINFNYISAITNGFSVLYSRWSYIVSIGSVYLIAFGLSNFIKYKKMNAVFILTVLSLMYFLYFSIPIFYSDVFLWRLRTVFSIGLVCVVFGIVYFGLFYSALKNYLDKSSFLVFLILCTFFEATSRYAYSNSKRSAFTHNYKVDFPVLDDSFRNTVNEIKGDDKGIFRIASDRFNLLVEPIMYDYLGLTSYCSVNDASYLSVLESSEPGHSAVTLKGPINNYALASLLGSKYFIATTEGNSAWSGFTEVPSQSKFKILVNKNYFPLVHYINQASLKKYEALVFNKNINTDQILEETSLEARSNSAQFSGFGKDKVISQINVKEDGILFFSLPFSESWVGIINGVKQTPLKVAHGFIGLEVKKGLITAELKYVPKGLVLGIYLSSMSLFIILFLFFKNKIINKF